MKRAKAQIDQTKEESREATLRDALLGNLHRWRIESGGQTEDLDDEGEGAFDALGLVSQEPLDPETAEAIICEFFALPVRKFLRGFTVGGAPSEEGSQEQAPDGVERLEKSHDLLYAILTSGRGGAWTKRALDALKARQKWVSKYKDCLAKFGDQLSTLQAEAERLPDTSMLRRSRLPSGHPPSLRDLAPMPLALKKTIATHESRFDIGYILREIESHSWYVDPIDRYDRHACLKAPSPKRLAGLTPEQRKQQDLYFMKTRSEDRASFAYQVAAMAHEVARDIRGAANSMQVGIDKQTPEYEAACRLFGESADAANRANNAKEAVSRAQTMEEAAESDKAVTESIDLAETIGRAVLSLRQRIAKKAPQAIRIGRSGVAFSARQLAEAVGDVKFSHSAAGNRPTVAAFLLAAEAVVPAALPQARGEVVTNELHRFVAGYSEHFEALRTCKFNLKDDLLEFTRPTGSKRHAKPGIPELHSLLLRFHDTFQLLRELTGGDGWIHGVPQRGAERKIRE